MKKKTVYLLTGLLLFFVCTPFALCADRFIDNKDGTISDTATNLMWSANDNQGDITWVQADKWVRFTFPLTVQKQYSNWRLPTPQELQDLYTAAQKTPSYKTDCGQPVSIAPGITITCGWVWSSEKRSITARVFNFQRGHFFTERMSRSRGYRALAVRNIK